MGLSEVFVVDEKHRVVSHVDDVWVHGAWNGNLLGFLKQVSNRFCSVVV